MGLEDGPSIIRPNLVPPNLFADTPKPTEAPDKEENSTKELIIVRFVDGKVQNEIYEVKSEDSEPLS